MCVEADPDRGVNRPVRDLTVSNFDNDRVYEDRCVHLVERTGSPVLYLVSDPRDGFLRDRECSGDVEWPSG